MARGKVSTTLLVAAGSVAGALLWRRRGARSREHIDLYFADGSMVSLAGDSPEAARLLPLARRVLSEAR
jgi:hypothetical protein